VVSGEVLIWPTPLWPDYYCWGSYVVHLQLTADCPAYCQSKRARGQFFFEKTCLPEIPICDALGLIEKAQVGGCTRCATLTVHTLLVARATRQPLSTIQIFSVGVHCQGVCEDCQQFRLLISACAGNSRNQLICSFAGC
jgi:hypothetical protein